MSSSLGVQSAGNDRSFGSPEEGGPASAPVKAVGNGTQKKIIDTLTVVSDFRSDKPNMLSLLVGDTVYVLNKTESGWWDGVIFSQNGTLRGWFPCTYCKSITSSDRQSTNGNRPQNITALLRQNLGNNAKSRKNSGVSFASSEHSFQSDVANTSSGAINKLTSSIDPVSPVVSLEKITVVSAQEVEAIFSSTGSSNVPIWTPILTTEGTLVYYNSELNVYCKELPYIENPELDDNTNIIVATKEEDPTPLSVVNLNESQQNIQKHRTSVKLRQSTTGYDRKESATGSVKSRSSIHSNTTTVHPWNSSLYCEPDLFYYDPTDIKTWSGLRDAFIYFLTLTSDAIHKKVGPLFYTYFNIASRLAVLIHLSARLAQHDLQKSGYQNRVQRRLKKIASSIAQVGINGNLYLTEPSAERAASTISQDTIRIDEDTTTENIEPSGAPDNHYLHQVETEIENLKKSAVACVKVFIQIASNQNNDQSYLPQVYPRFLTGFFSGGNWRNPFVPEPKDPFAGKEVVKSLHHKRVPKTSLSRETMDKLESLKDQIKLGWEDLLIILRERENTQARNVEILSRAHEHLHVCSKYIDIIEGLDFSVFLNNRRNSTIGEFDPSKLIYPVLTEFFESKQDFRDITVTLVMECQNLTLVDPTVFKSIKEDRLDSDNKFANIEPEKSARELEIELLKIDVERDHGISIDVDSNLIESILKALDLLDISITLVQQLISEKEALLNYATRVMNDDFAYDFYNNEREDSTLATDEYQLPASTTNRHITKDVPWYLESEEYNLIFTNNDTIKGGTREALIQRLTHHDLLDAPFNVTFLITFRSMMKTTTLIELLIRRFNIQPPENLAYEEYTNWVEKKSYPIKLRVVNIMKSLLQKYWIPSYNEPKLAKTWGSFIDILLEQKFPGSEQLFKQYKKKVIDGEVNEQVGISENTIFSAKSKKLKLLEVDPDEMANQLTIKESGMYSKIKQSEFLDKSWNNKYGSLGGFQNLQRFISNSNDLTNFVTTQIVNHNDIKKRVALIKHFVTIANKCRQLNNFSSMTAIISALYSSPIHRLKKTWKSVPAPTLSLMNKMNDLMNSSRNFSEYREHLRLLSDKPCVPFLGVFLSDLTFTTNGNPDHLHGDPNLVNFSKRSKTVDILREISRYQNLKYNLKKNDDIQDFITANLKNLLNIDEQYNRSLVIEPRVKVSQQLQNNNHKSSVSSNSAVAKTRPMRHFNLATDLPML